MGRASVDIIKTKGYKVSALEIENMLLDHQDIQDCAVVGIQDPAQGERVAVVIVIKQGSILNSESVKEWCKSSLAGYKCPSVVLFHHELPRNAMGKVDKKGIKNLIDLYQKSNSVGK